MASFIRIKDHPDADLCVLLARPKEKAMVIAMVSPKIESQLLRWLSDTSRKEVLDMKTKKPKGTKTKGK